MIEQEFNSTNLKKIKYEESTKKLEVTFVSGPTYIYIKVDKPVVDGLLVATSKGQYFNQNIRYKYKYQVLSK